MKVYKSKLMAPYSNVYLAANGHQNAAPGFDPSSNMYLLFIVSAEQELQKAADAIIASSTQNASTMADRAIDGDVATRWNAPSGAMPQTLTLDLGAKVSVGGYEINWQSGDTRSYNYKVEVSADGTNYVTSLDMGGNVNTGADEYRVTATTTAEGLRLAGSGHPALILLDPTPSADATALEAYCRELASAVLPAATALLLLHNPLQEFDRLRGRLADFPNLALDSLTEPFGQPDFDAKLERLRQTLELLPTPPMIENPYSPQCFSWLSGTADVAGYAYIAADGAVLERNGSRGDEAGHGAVHVQRAPATPRFRGAEPAGRVAHPEPVLPRGLGHLPPGLFRTHHGVAFGGARVGLQHRGRRQQGWPHVGDLRRRHGHPREAREAGEAAAYVGVDETEMAVH